MKPAVSIVVPVHNRERTIVRCLTSILHQTFRNFEAVVVDDASTDQTRRYIASVADARIRLLERARRGGAQAARNDGIRQARADRIAFLDSDDEWLPETLASLIAAAEQRPGTARLLICGYGRCIDANGSYRYDLRTPLESGPPPVLLRQVLRQPGPMFQGMLTTKQALTEIGYLDEQLRSWQEWDTSIRLAEICDFVFVDKALFLYHHDDRSAISANLYADLQGYLHVIIKHRRAILHYLSQAGWDAHLQSLISRSLGMNLPGFARYLVRSQPLPFSRKVVLMLSIHLRLLHGRLGCLRPIAGSFGRLW